MTITIFDWDSVFECQMLFYKWHSIHDWRLGTAPSIKHGIYLNKEDVVMMKMHVDNCSFVRV